MDIHGYQFDGEREGLAYVLENEQAISELVSRVRQNGSASFLYQEKHYIVMPTASGGFSVHEGHNRSGIPLSGGLHQL